MRLGAFFAGSGFDSGLGFGAAGAGGFVSAGVRAVWMAFGTAGLSFGGAGLLSAVAGGTGVFVPAAWGGEDIAGGDVTDWGTFCKNVPCAGAPGVPLVSFGSGSFAPL